MDGCRAAASSAMITLCCFDWHDSTQYPVWRRDARRCLCQAENCKRKARTASCISLMYRSKPYFLVAEDLPILTTPSCGEILKPMYSVHYAVSMQQAFSSMQTMKGRILTRLALFAWQLRVLPKSAMSRMESERANLPRQDICLRRFLYRYRA